MLLFLGSFLSPPGPPPAAFLAAAASRAPSFGLHTTMVNIPSANFKTDAACFQNQKERSQLYLSNIPTNSM